MINYDSGFEGMQELLEARHSLKPYARGKRSIVYKARMFSTDVIIKAEKKGIGAICRIDNEARWLEKLNSKGIGPKLLARGKDFVVCEFVGGVNIRGWLSSAKPDEMRKLIIESMAQCRALDKLKVSKEEMQNPYKHIIVTEKRRPVFIDFERCHNTEKPKNVTQFCQYLCSGNVLPVLISSNINPDIARLKEALKEYKNNYGEGSFKRILVLMRLLH